MLSKMINIHDCSKGPTNEEIQILLKSLKSEMKLPLLNDYVHTDRYFKQLIAKHYVNELLEGYTLEFMMTRSVKHQGTSTYLKMNKRLMNIFRTMSGVIKRRGLNLNSSIVFLKAWYCFITARDKVMGVRAQFRPFFRAILSCKNP